MSKDVVYKWCSTLERLRTELKNDHEKERTTSVRPGDLDGLMKACEIVNADCVKLGPVAVKKIFHGGNYDSTEESIRITFRE